MRAAIVIVLGFAVIAASCNKKAEGQTVAIVNGEEITAAELNSELAVANLPADADKEEARARILQGVIDRRLLAQHAKAEGLDKTPEYLTRQRRMTEDLLINTLAMRQINSTQLPSGEEVNTFVASRPNMFAKREFWNLEQLRFKLPKGGISPRMVATKSLDELSRVLSDGRIPFVRSKKRIQTAVVPPDQYRRIMALQPGEPFIIPIGEEVVASVIVSREAAPVEGELVRSQAVAAMRREQGAEFMNDRLQSLRKSAKIEYQGGYAPAKG